jgi:hypothetical protein
MSGPQGRQMSEAVQGAGRSIGTERRKYPKINQMIGKKYGRLTILKEGSKKGKVRFCVCSCDCGKIKSIQLYHILRGHSQSCGCLHKEQLSLMSTTHGLTKTTDGKRIGKIWSQMKARCLNKNNPAYRHYGGRGISICQEWMDLNNFYTWAINNGYKDNLTIDRKNNDGDYCPENCNFIPQSEQPKNRRGLHWIEFNGERRTMSSWARKMGMSRACLKCRLKRGWSVEDALTTPNLRIEGE